MFDLRLLTLPISMLYTTVAKWNDNKLIKMAKKLKVLTKESLKSVKTPALARKYNCSDVYVRYILTGARAANSVLAQLILKDANDILAIHERDTSKLI